MSSKCDLTRSSVSAAAASLQSSARCRQALIWSPSLWSITPLFVRHAAGTASFNQRGSVLGSGLVRIHAKRSLLTCGIPQARSFRVRAKIGLDFELVPLRFFAPIVLPALNTPRWAEFHFAPASEGGATLQIELIISSERD